MTRGTAVLRAAAECADSGGQMHDSTAFAGGTAALEECSVSVTAFRDFRIKFKGFGGKFIGTYSRLKNSFLLFTAEKISF